MTTNKDSLSVTDNRTGKSYEVPIVHGTYLRSGAAIRAADLDEKKALEAKQAAEEAISRRKGEQEIATAEAELAAVAAQLAAIRRLRRQK